MTDQERELDIALAEAEQENRLLRARNERLERELAAEREACALLIEENAQECNGLMQLVLQANAAAIRARGQA